MIFPLQMPVLILWILMKTISNSNLNNKQPKQLCAVSHSNMKQNSDQLLKAGLLNLDLRRGQLRYKKNLIFASVVIINVINEKSYIAIFHKIFINQALKIKLQIQTFQFFIKSYFHYKKKCKFKTSQFFKGQNEKRAALSLKKKELRKVFNFTTGDFSALIDSLINEEPESETLEILKLEDKMSRKQYCSFCELVESERISQIKREIHEIRACTWQNELKSAQREELSHLFSSISFDSAPLVNAILQEVDIVDSLQDAMNPDEHDALISLLQSNRLTTIKRNLWSIKKQKNSSDQLEKRIKQFKVQLEEMFKDITVDTSDLVSAILEREQEEEVLLEKQMRVKEYKKLEKIIESEPFLQIKEGIKDAYEGEHKNLLQLNAKREELTQKLKPFGLNINHLIDNLLSGAQTNEIIEGFKEVMSFRHFNELHAILEIMSNHNNQQQLNPFEMEKSKDLVELLKEFKSEQIQLIVKAILNQSIEADIIKGLSLKLPCLEFHRLQAIIKSSELSSIRKSIQDWREDERKKKELINILESFNIDCRELIEAIISGVSSLEDQILERLSEEMSTKEYNRLVQALDGEEMKKYYSSEGKKFKMLSKFSEFDQKAGIVSKALLSDNFQPSIKEELLQKLSRKIVELNQTLEAIASPKYPSFTFFLNQRKERIEELEKQSRNLQRQKHLLLSLIKQRTIQSNQYREFQRKQKSIQQAQDLFKKAKAEDYKNNYDFGLGYYIQCLQIQILAVGKEGRETAPTLYQIGSTYSTQEKHTKAIEYYKQCITIKEKYQEERDNMYIQILYDLEGSFKMIEDFKSGTEYFEQRLLHNQQIQFQDGVNKCAKWLAKNLFALGEKLRVKELNEKYNLSL